MGDVGSPGVPLFTPGPVTIVDAVREAQSRPTIYHRGQAYGRMLSEVAVMLGEVLGTTGEVHCVSSSGTGTIEFAIQNVCRAGDSVVVASNGYFGERIALLCARLDLDARHVRAAWSDPLPVDRVDACCDGAAAVIAVHHETSTGRVNDIEALAEVAARHDALLVVDAIASAGALPVNMDRDGLDVVIATSQKGLGGTPGIGIVAASERAWRRMEQLPPPATLAGDWHRVRRAFRRDPPESQWTPPVSLMSGLHAALRELTVHRSLAAHQAERAAIGQATRAGLAALGFRPWPSGAAPVAPVTVAEPPAGVAPADLIAVAYATTGARIAAGQGPIADRVVRVSHLGVEPFDVLGLLGTIHIALRRLDAERPHTDWPVRAWDAYTRQRA